MIRVCRSVDGKRSLAVCLYMALVTCQVRFLRTISRRIAGIITDSIGAVASGAKVELTNRYDVH